MVIVRGGSSHGALCSKLADAIAHLVRHAAESRHTFIFAAAFDIHSLYEMMDTDDNITRRQKQCSPQM